MSAKILMWNSSSLSSQRRGAAVVELAIVLPIFMLVILGIVEFGRAMMVSQIVSNAAREGARRAILNGSTNHVVTTEVADAIREACQVDPRHVTVTITLIPNPSNPDPLNQLAQANEGDLVTIQVSVPFREVSYMTGKYLNNAQIKGIATMRHE